MNRKERASRIAAILDETIGEPEIPLYHINPYTLLIAVLLSAQTTDAGVNKITPALFKLAPTPQKMVKIPYDKLLSLIKTCGLAPTKAKNILKLSQILIDKHDGKIPNTFEELEALPGVGHKTASVVLAQAFDIPTFPVDTHIFRSARRWKLSRGKTVEAVEKDLKKLFPQKDWNKIHIQIILFSRQFCPARAHNEKECPICKELL